MKNLLFKAGGTLLIGFLAVIFTGCKDQRNANDDYRETYPPDGGTEQLSTETNDSNDTLDYNSGMDNSQNQTGNNQTGNNQTGSNQTGRNQTGNRNSGSVPDDGTGSNPSTYNNKPTGN